MIILGAANACIWGPLSVSATRNLPPQRAGAGSGVYNETRQMASVLGSAAITTIMASAITSHLSALNWSPQRAVALTAVLEAAYFRRCCVNPTRRQWQIP